MNHPTKYACKLACLMALAVSGMAQADEAQLARGKKVFDQSCFACHGAGVDKPGTAALAAKYERSQFSALDQGPPVNAALVSFFVRNGVSVMPPFRKTEISDAELADLSAYIARAR